MKTLLTYGTPVLLGFSVGLACLLALSAVAEDTELDTGPRTFPYEGVVDLDGTPFEGQLDVRVTLHGTDEERWVEDHGAVSVSPGGRFGLQIGQPSGGAPSWVFDTEAVHVELAMRAADSDIEHVALAGRQRVRPVPFAYWAAEAGDLPVNGEMYVEGTATLGTAQTHGLSFAGGPGDLNLSTPLALAAGSGRGMRMAGAFAMTHELRNGRPALVVRGPEGGVQRLSVDGEALLTLSSAGTTMARGLTVPQDRSLSGAGTLRVDGREPTLWGDTCGVHQQLRWFVVERDRYELDRGEDEMDLGPAEERMCGLMAAGAVEFSNGDVIIERRCSVSVVQGRWVLRGENHTDFCHAHCFHW